MQPVHHLRTQQQTLVISYPSCVAAFVGGGEKQHFFLLRSLLLLIKDLFQIVKKIGRTLFVGHEDKVNGRYQPKLHSSGKSF